jgi:3-oxoisoapionate decarboxylase
MQRRTFLSAAAGIAGLRAVQAGAETSPGSRVKLGIDLFSLRNQKWTPFELMDYSKKQGAQVVHFSEIRFIGNLEPDNLRKVRAHAAELGLELEIGTRSICPTSKMFDRQAGSAEEQLTRMLVAAETVGSKLVRAVLGSADDRRPGPIEAHIHDMTRVLRNVKSQVVDRGLKIAIENHAGDMQARELKMLIEEAGPDFVGACLDSGNPLWAMEDPHLTLETLHPYVLTSHVRDSAVWLTPEGAAVTWVQMGRGNVDIASYVRRYAELCPGRALSLESIVFGPRPLPFRKPEFWDAYRNTPAWEFERFLQIAERGKPYANEPWETKDEATRERAALEESLAFTKSLLNGTANRNS